MGFGLVSLITLWKGEQVSNATKIDIFVKKCTITSWILTIKPQIYTFSERTQ